jgi:hypothetical protein
LIFEFNSSLGNRQSMMRENGYFLSSQMVGLSFNSVFIPESDKYLIVLISTKFINITSLCDYSIIIRSNVIFCRLVCKGPIAFVQGFVLSSPVVNTLNFEESRSIVLISQAQQVAPVIVPVPIIF